MTSSFYRSKAAFFIIATLHSFNLDKVSAASHDLRDDNSHNKLRRSLDTVRSPQGIVGGSFSPKDEYPWFVGAGGCGASLISSEFILTAAHCHQYINSVEVGDFCKQGDNCGQISESFTIQQKFMHPEYNGSTLSHDFSLMKLSSKSTITPVQIDDGSYSSKYVPGNDKLWTVGFGATSSGGSGTSNLKHVEVSYVGQETCNQNYGGKIDDSMMCAADPGEDACQGDSGGPLYDKNNDVLVGVVSWGYGCANPNYPGVYSRISDEYEWIKSIVCENSSSPKPSFCTPCKKVTLSMTMDSYPEDISWSFKDKDGNVIDSASGYSNPYQSYEYEWCVAPDGCYDFELIDSYGDGLYSGGYSLTFDGKAVMDYNNAQDKDGKYVKFGGASCSSNGMCSGNQLWVQRVLSTSCQ